MRGEHVCPRLFSCGHFLGLGGDTGWLDHTRGGRLTELRSKGRATRATEKRRINPGEEGS